MMKKMQKIFVAAFLLLSSVSIIGAGPAAAGGRTTVEKTVKYCFTCHSIDPNTIAAPGYSPPKIAGQNAKYIAKALMAYREGTRNNTLMHSLAEMIPHELVGNVAEYFSIVAASQLPKYQTEKLASDDIGRGKALADKSCAKCHDGSKKNADAGMPSLNGQYYTYLMSAMTDYKVGVRDNNDMKNIAAKLLNKDTSDIAAFYASLSGLSPTTSNK